MSTKRTEPRSRNVYLRMLFQLYEVLSRRTKSRFSTKVMERLCMSKRNMPPMSLFRISQVLAKRPNRIAVVVGKVVDDEKLVAVPKMTVAALRFSKTAQARIHAAGGETLTLDQLPLRSPLGKNTLLLRGPRHARKAIKYFGVPGAKGSKTKARVRSKGVKFEKRRN